MPELLREQVYQAIKLDILTGIHKAGEQLSANQLAERYQVSATPVREALNALQQEGLVEIIPRVGCFVSHVTVKDVRDIFQLRLIIEGASAELAAQNITDEELNRLEQIQHDYVVGDTDSYRRYLEANREFHYGIALATRNRRLAEIVGKLLDQMQRLLLLGLDLGDYADDIIEHHPNVIAALRKRDSVEARKVMVEGIEKTREAVLEAIVRGASLPIHPPG